MPKEGSILPTRAFPDFADHVGVGFGEGIVAHLRAHKRFRIEGTSRGIVDHAILNSVQSVAGRHCRGRGCLELGFRHEVFGGDHNDLRPEIGRKKSMPIDRRTSRDDPIIIIRVTLRFHQSLPPARRAADKIGIARRLAIERLRECLAHDVHLMDAEIGVVLDRLPVEPSVGVERKAAAAALVTGVRGACGVTLSHRPAQAAGASSGKSAPAVSAKPSVPIGGGQADENLDAITGRRMCDCGRNAARSVGRIERGGIDHGIGNRNFRQALARAYRRRVGVNRFWRSLRGSDKSDADRECYYEHGSCDLQVRTQDLVFHAELYVNRWPISVSTQIRLTSR